MYSNMFANNVVKLKKPIRLKGVNGIIVLLWKGTLTPFPKYPGIVVKTYVSHAIPVSIFAPWALKKTDYINSK